MVVACLHKGEKGAAIVLLHRTSLYKSVGGTGEGVLLRKNDRVKWVLGGGGGLLGKEWGQPFREGLNKATTSFGVKRGKKSCRAVLGDSYPTHLWAGVWMWLNQTRWD